MEINELNYELYALDYAEGTLDGIELQAMEAFLESRPEIREDILAIASTEIPVETATHPDLASLKRDQRAAVIIPSSAWAVAAALVALFGLFFAMNMQAPSGQQAEGAPALRIYYPVASLYQSDGVIEYRIVIEEPGSPDYVASYDQPGVQSSDIGSEDVTPQSPKIIFNVVDNQELITEDEEDFEEFEFTPQDVVELKTDRQHVLPVTIELHGLSTDHYIVTQERVEDGLAALELKEQRRRQFRDGALTLLQDGLVPKTFNGVFGN